MDRIAQFPKGNCAHERRRRPKPGGKRGKCVRFTGGSAGRLAADAALGSSGDRAGGREAEDSAGGLALGLGLDGLLEGAALGEAGETFGGRGEGVGGDELGADGVDALDLRELLRDAVGGEPGLEGVEGELEAGHDFGGEDVAVEEGLEEVGFLFWGQ
jgi:hypothetical protein